jgi:hypothetical protein
VHWPSLGAEEAAYEWEDLGRWVQEYQRRYPLGTVVPPCWYRHEHFVELLSALRDHERASYGRAALGDAAMEWQNARQHAEMQLDLWRRKLGCDISGRGHAPLSGGDEASEWDAHVLLDVERRRLLSASPDVSPTQRP